ncbi:MAG: DUF4198 domain-containing protein [Gammaproteobacteria bacterium]|nr:DUF4198 domain-containing protein [Gammaproteobacteria bacterium]
MSNKTNIGSLFLVISILIATPGASAQTKAEPAVETQQINGQHSQHRRGAKNIVLTDSEGAVAQLWKPDLSIQPLTIKHDSITLPRTGVDNYHAVVVEKDRGLLKESYIRYEYMHGKPSGHSTSELTASRKSTFEIIPDPVPREHQHYQSGETWNFVLRFKGTPAAGIPVTLETSQGSSVDAVSDSAGKISLTIPDDFPDVKEGVRDQRRAELVIHAEMIEDGVTFRTRLGSEYRVNPSHWQSFGLGTAVTGLGMLAGVFLGRIKRTETKRTLR